ncbi:MAG: hypothetical protein SXQ77_03430 [Halobacteria archaeon]|nr:hypothetical protein [Halobacteria archaeon]
MIASELGVHEVEAMVVVNALRDVLYDASEYDPYLDIERDLFDGGTTEG